MAEVSFISTNIIRSTNPSRGAPHRIELTPWDLHLLLIGPSQVGLVFLKPTASQLKQLLAGTVIDHLKISLSRTLDFFHPLAGRLAVIQNDDGTSSFFIDCNNAGVHFIHSIAHGTTVRDILDPGFVPRIVSSFFHLNGSLNCEGLSNPLLAVQVTELVDGFFIGCTMNHVVVDGTSFYHFLSSWSEIARGMEVVSQPPILKRWFPSDIQPPISIPLNLQELELDAYRLPPPQFRERVFHFTKEKIAELKEKANFEMGTHRISSLQALAAHMWTSIMLCKGISEDQETTYIILIDSRARLQPPLPENYFGNAVYDVGFTTKVGLLVGKGPSRAALEMSSTIEKQKNEETRSFLKGWVANPRLATATTFADNLFTVVSSPRFDAYGNDMGWGRPVAVRRGLSNMCDGKIVVFQGAEEGSVDVEVCLLPEKLHSLERILVSEGVLPSGSS